MLDLTDPMMSTESAQGIYEIVWRYVNVLPRFFLGHISTGTQLTYFVHCQENLESP